LSLILLAGTVSIVTQVRDDDDEDEDYDRIRGYGTSFPNWITRTLRAEAACLYEALVIAY
jgi:hypothetical protein